MVNLICSKLNQCLYSSSTFTIHFPMNITQVTAEAWIVPSDIRIVHIDTDLPRIEQTELYFHAINFTHTSVQFIYSENEYQKLDDLASKVLENMPWDICVVVDITWRDNIGVLIWNIYVYREIKDFWRCVALDRRCEFTLTNAEWYITRFHQAVTRILKD
jgi:hypothetical protein